jgi:hypothetical protein
MAWSNGAEAAITGWRDLRLRWWRLPSGSRGKIAIDQTKRGERDRVPPELSRKRARVTLRAYVSTRTRAGYCSFWDSPGSLPHI